MLSPTFRCTLVHMAVLVSYLVRRLLIAGAVLFGLAGHSAVSGAAHPFRGSG